MGHMLCRRLSSLCSTSRCQAVQVSYKWELADPNHANHKVVSKAKVLNIVLGLEGMETRETCGMVICLLDWSGGASTSQVRCYTMHLFAILITLQDGDLAIGLAAVPTRPLLRSIAEVNLYRQHQPRLCPFWLHPSFHAFRCEFCICSSSLSLMYSETTLICLVFPNHRCYTEIHRSPRRLHRNHFLAWPKSFPFRVKFHQSRTCLLDRTCSDCRTRKTG